MGQVREKPIVTWGDVWGIRWVRENHPAILSQLLLDEFVDMWTSIIMVIIYFLIFQG
jgi:hypothetical protein